jgi:putative flippase GtrA
LTAPVRFATAGVLQNGLNVAVFALATAVGVQYRVAAVLAGLVALVASFLLNRQSTFTSRTAPIHHQGLRYLIVFASAVALGVVLLTFSSRSRASPRSWRRWRRSSSSRP